MTLLRKIQSDAVDSNVDISTLLRKCKILAARLKHKEFSNWVESELNGYKSNEDLPDYRIIDVQSYGNFSGPFGSGLKNAPIPPFCLPKKLRHLANKAYLTEGISHYSSLIKQDENTTLSSSWPAEVVARYGENIYQNMNCIGAWRIIGSNQIQGLIDTVRNRVLSFVLEIESEAPNAGEALPQETPIADSKLNQIYQTYILGNVSNVSTGGSNVTQISTGDIIQNDLNSLLDFLRSLNIGDEDLNELKTALDKDDKPSKEGSFGNNISTWIGKMVSKAASGVWNISTSVAAEILSKSITRYYGI